jgi:hypothetical protein
MYSYVQIGNGEQKKKGQNVVILGRRFWVLESFFLKESSQINEGVTGPSRSNIFDPKLDHCLSQLD